jgi:hypothetical protein
MYLPRKLFPHFPSVLHVPQSYPYCFKGSAVGWGTAQQACRSRVRFLKKSQKFFIRIILPAALWTRGLTQSLTEMCTRNISWEEKAAGCVRLTTLPPSCVVCLEILEPQPPGTLKACAGLYRNYFTIFSTAGSQNMWATGHCLLAGFCKYGHESTSVTISSSRALIHGV